jgi:UDP-glucuronate decarboxylase
VRSSQVTSACAGSPPSEESRPGIFQLPLARLKHFLEGYREGDGTHTNLHEKRELAFNTSSERLATDLVYLLLRFGIVASLGHYETTFQRKYGERRFPFWRVSVCELSDFDILSWDRGVEQTLNARRAGDLVWARVTAVEPTEITAYVYDFAVPGCENFVAGLGVFAHNTFGPRMRPDDGRVVSNFIVQALKGEPLTIYGEGQQTRSFTYVSDLIEGIVRLLMHEDTGPSESAEVLLEGPPDIHLPVNIGNPTEFTVAELAQKVLSLTGSASPIEHRPLPVDDPQVRRPDITRAGRLLGWEPRVPLEEGLKLTIPYFRESLGV